MKKIAHHPRFRYQVLTIACIVSFITPFMGSSLNLALPVMGQQFGMNTLHLGWVVTVFLLSSAIFQVPFGRLADIVGRKKIFLTGTAVFGFSSLLCSFAPNTEIILILRALQGIGGAMTFSTGMAIVTSVFPPEERGKAMGILVAVVYFAAAAGPFLGGLITHHLGWRFIFAISSVLCFLALVAGFRVMRTEWRDAHADSFDWTGSLIYGLALLGIIWGFTELSVFWGRLLLLAGLILFAAFLWVENRVESPVLDVSLFKSNKVFLYSSVAALINYAATFAISFLLSLYLQYVRGFDSYHAGLILLTQPLVQALVSPSSGKMSDRIGAAPMATTGMLIIVAGLLCLLFLRENTQLWMLITILAILGTGFGIFSSPNTSAILGSVNKKHYGLASATTGTMRLTGQAFSMGIAMMTLSVFLGKSSFEAEMAPQFLTAAHICFGIFAALCCVGAFASYQRHLSQ